MEKRRKVGKTMEFFVGSNFCCGQVFVTQLNIFCQKNEIESSFIIVSAVQPV